MIGIGRWRRQSTLCDGAKQLPPVTLLAHGVGNLDETSDVGTGDQRRNNTSFSVLLASLPTSLVAVDHDGLELGVNLLVSPLELFMLLSASTQIFALTIRLTRWEFWAISRPETATPPQLAALPGA